MQETSKVKHITFPHPPGAGGPGSFQIRFEEQLKANNWVISYKANNADAVFVVGGTRKLFWLWKMKRKGIPIIYRLDGIPWLHRKKKVSFKTYCKVELMIITNKFIHAFLADKIVYQSEFVEQWWNKEAWRFKKKASIIYNGVNLAEASKIDHKKPIKQHRLVVLEGVIDYTPYAIRLLNDLALSLPDDISIELYGHFEDKTQIEKLHKRLNYKGFVEQDKIVEVMYAAVYLSLDINPACPNTVIEAMCCSAPVVGFDTGALKELVDKDSGIIVPYGSNPWQLGYPDVENLKKAIINVFSNYDTFSKHAYKRAETKYNIKNMTKNYLSIIHKLISHDA